MKRSARSNWQMLQAVVNFLEKEGTKISTVERIPEIMETLKSKRDAIQVLDAERRQNIKVITAKKKSKLEALNASTLSLCGVTHSFAHQSKNEELALEMNITKTFLTKSSSTVNLSKCITLFTLAEEWQKELAPLGWDEAKMNSHRLLLEETALMITAPREAIVNRSKITNHSYTLIREAVDILKNQLDPLVQQFEAEEPFVVSEYNDIRKSIQYGARSKPEMVEAPLPALPPTEEPDPGSPFS